MSGGEAWTTSTQLRFRDFDYLGHMTSTSYLALLEEARVDWLAASAADGQPSYVVAHQELTFHHEVLPEDGPVTISIRSRVHGRSRFEVIEEITGSRGHLHATARAQLVAWDREARRPRPLSRAERELLAATECGPADQSAAGGPR